MHRGPFSLSHISQSLVKRVLHPLVIPGPDGGFISLGKPFVMPVLEGVPWLLFGCEPWKRGFDRASGIRWHHDFKLAAVEHGPTPNALGSSSHWHQQVMRMVTFLTRSDTCSEMFFIPERSQTKHDHASHLVLEPPSRCHKIYGTVTHKFLAITILERVGLVDTFYDFMAYWMAL